MPFTTTTLVILSNFGVLEPICTSPRDRVPSKRPWVASVFTASMLLNALDVTFKATAAAGASKISIIGVTVVDVVTLVAFVVFVELVALLECLPMDTFEAFMVVLCENTDKILTALSSSI